MALVASLIGSVSQADQFTIVNDKGEEEVIDARLHGSDRYSHALELSTGEIRLVPIAAVKERTPGDDPTPVSPDELAAQLSERFGSELTRTHVEEPFVVAVVLTAPLERANERQLTAFLRKAGRFMTSIETVFSRFGRDLQLDVEDSRFPLTVLIFESDEDFMAYAETVTGGRGLSAENIAGFYNGLTNWLTLRMSECHSFEVPLHEAIHQQVYNRLLPRLAPIPTWFNEGIATGFESDGERIDTNPARISRRYAQQATAGASQVSWEDLIAGDEAFGGDVLAGDAYTQAWCLHWMLVTEHADAYREYVHSLAARDPLEENEDGQRLKAFESAFGVTVDSLRDDFGRLLEAGVRRQRITFPEATPGISRSTQALGDVSLQAVVDGSSGRLYSQGQIQNICPFRTLQFRVRLEMAGTAGLEWVTDGVPPLQTVNLAEQSMIPTGQSFRVVVESSVAE
jgi:hypothetical protein